MEILGIKFVPLNTSLRRHLQTLAAGIWFLTISFGGLTGLILSLYLLLYSDYWIVILIYLTWCWGIDINACETGNRRPIEWVRRLSWWSYMKEYFPVRLEKISGVELDPKQNYLLCCFPHGMLCTGAFLSFATDVAGFPKLFPHHTSNFLTLKQHFCMPFFRELIYSLGMHSSSANSISRLLSTPGGGKAPLLAVGGASEAFNCKPGQYRLVLKNRKGFVKLALENGTALVPVLSFGETDLFDQVEHPYVRAFQNFWKNILGVAPLFPIGRGFFQYSFGVVPHAKPITTLVGNPMRVEQIVNPTAEELDSVHEKFINHLTQLFEEQKYNYIDNPDTTTLIIE